MRFLHLICKAKTEINLGLLRKWRIFEGGSTQTTAWFPTGFFFAAIDNNESSFGGLDGHFQRIRGKSMLCERPPSILVFLKTYFGHILVVKIFYFIEAEVFLLYL